MYAPESPGPPARVPSYGRDLLVLVLSFGVIYFLGLGRAGLMNPDEGRYGEIPREMVATGDWVTPRLDGVNYFEKPPLGYWVTAACLSVFGSSETAARMFPVLFGLGGVLLTYAAVRRIHGRVPAMASAIVLGSSVFYFAMARILTLDLAVAVLMSATLLCFTVAVREPPGATRRWLFYGLYVSSALATLTKGLIGVLLTGAVMFLWLLLFKQWKKLKPLYLPTGLLLFLAIAVPWHVLVSQRNPSWAQFFFVDQQWNRFTTTEHSRAGPWYYFIPVVIVGFFPWIGFLWGALWEVISTGWAKRAENAQAWYYVTWAGFIFLFFSKSQSKLVGYILPVFPPLAILIGCWVARRWNEESPARSRLGIRTRVGMNVFAFFCGLLAFAALVAVFKHGVLKDPGQAEALRPIGIAVAAILLLGGVTAAWAERILSARAGLITLMATTIGFYLVLPMAMPSVKPGTKPLALYVKRMAQPGDVVVHYHGFFHDFFYYAERFAGTVEFHGDEVELQNDPVAAKSGAFMDEKHFRTLWDGPARVWAVAKHDTTGPLFADPAFHYHLIGQDSGYYLFSNRP